MGWWTNQSCTDISTLLQPCCLHYGLRQTGAVHQALRARSAVWRKDEKVKTWMCVEGSVSCSGFRRFKRPLGVNIDSFLSSMKQQSTANSWLLWGSRKEKRSTLAVSWLQELFAWQQSRLKSWLLFQGFWDVFMQSLVLALVYLPGIRAPRRIHRQSGKLVHQKVAASAQAFHCKQSVQVGKHALRMAA